MKTKNLIIFSSLLFVIIMTTFGLSAMSVLFARFLLLNLILVTIISSKLFVPLRRLALQNIMILTTWLLQILTVMIFCKEVDLFLSFGYSVLFCSMMTLVVLMVIYAIKEWVENQSKEIISVIQMAIAALSAVLVLLLSSGFFVTNDYSMGLLCLSLIVFVVECSFFAVTLYFMVRNVSKKTLKYGREYEQHQEKLGVTDISRNAFIQNLLGFFGGGFFLFDNRRKKYKLKKLVIASAARQS